MPEQSTEAIINEIVDNFRPARTLHDLRVEEANLTVWGREDMDDDNLTDIGQLIVKPEEFWAVMTLLARLKGCDLNDLIRLAEDGIHAGPCACQRCASKSDQPEAAA